jgi:hypothetical protein
VLTNGGSASPLQSSPFARAIGGLAGGQASPVRWLLPYLGVPNSEVPRGERNSTAAADSFPNDANVTRHVPRFASAAFSMVAEAPAALGAWAGDAGQPANLLGNVTLSTEAIDQALASVLEEVEQLGGDLYGWFDEVNVESWARTAAAVAVVGVGGAAAMRWRGKREEDEQSERASSTWLFHQLQSSAGGI